MSAASLPLPTPPAAPPTLTKMYDPSTSHIERNFAVDLTNAAESHGSPRNDTPFAGFIFRIYDEDRDDVSYIWHVSKIKGDPDGCAYCKSALVTKNIAYVDIEIF